MNTAFFGFLRRSPLVLLGGSLPAKRKLEQPHRHKHSVTDEATDPISLTVPLCSAGKPPPARCKQTKDTMQFWQFWTLRRLRAKRCASSDHHYRDRSSPMRGLQAAASVRAHSSVAGGVNGAPAGCPRCSNASWWCVGVGTGTV